MFDKARDEFVALAEAAGHTLARDPDGGLHVNDGIYPEDYHSVVNCTKCQDAWCYLCRNRVQPCEP